MRNYNFPNPETRLFLSIGSPVLKQKTLYMHNKGFESLGINALYLAQEIPIGRLKEGVMALQELKVAGISITMPHKVEILKYLDEITDAVREIGACNTIHIVDGRLVGYNSDWIGAIETLKKKCELKGKNVVVLGAGGASRAIVYGLKKEGAFVTVLNRDVEKVKKLATEFDVNFGDINDISEYKSHDILINATSVGTRKSENCDCFLCRFLGLSESGKTEQGNPFLENKIALDVVFQRNSTEFTKAAQLNGYNVVFGHEMLVTQGAFQFELFTGHKAPVDAMYAELKRCLEDW